LIKILTHNLQKYVYYTSIKINECLNTMSRGIYEKFEAYIIKKWKYIHVLVCL